MGKGIRQLKAGNSKSTLVKAIMMYQKALLYYSKEEHWAKSAEGIYKWVGEEEPTQVAKTVLGLDRKTRRSQGPYERRATGVREPDDQIGSGSQPYTEKSGADQPDAKHPFDPIKTVGE